MATDHCLVCGLAFNVRGCVSAWVNARGETVAAVCANPEGSAEAERLRAEQAAMVEKPWWASFERARAEARTATKPPRPPSDLDTLRSMLERAGIPFDATPDSITLHDAPPEEQRSYDWADTTFHFAADGSLESVDLEGS